MDEMLHEAMNKLFSEALTAFGQIVAADFAKVINKYPHELQPIAIGQIEAFAAATRATFSDKEKQIADMIRDSSITVAIPKLHKRNEDD